MTTPRKPANLTHFAFAAPQRSACKNAAALSASGETLNPRIFFVCRPQRCGQTTYFQSDLGGRPAPPPTAAFWFDGARYPQTSFSAPRAHTLPRRPIAAALPTSPTLVPGTSGAKRMFPPLAGNPAAPACKFTTFSNPPAPSPWMTVGRARTPYISAARPTRSIPLQKGRSAWPWQPGRKLVAAGKPAPVACGGSNSQCFLGKSPADEWGRGSQRCYHVFVSPGPDPDRPMNIDESPGWWLKSDRAASSRT